MALHFTHVTMLQPIAIKALSIPELLQRIYPFLSNSDLACCCVVSKAFSDIFTPILWHTISLITQKQHCCFTDSPDIESTLSRNAKYIRVIQVETCGVLAPFLKVDATSLRNIHMLQLQFSVRPTLRKRTKGPSYVDAMRDIRKQEARNVLPVKVTDWFQERDVFLWRHEIASRSLAPDQSKLQHIREAQLNSLYQVVEVMKLQLGNMVRMARLAMGYRRLILLCNQRSNLEQRCIDDPFFADIQSLYDKIEAQSTRVNFALAKSQQLHPATFIRQYMQLLLCVVNLRNTQYNKDSGLKEEFDKTMIDIVQWLQDARLDQLQPEKIDDVSKRWHLSLDRNLENIQSHFLSERNTVNDSQGDEDQLAKPFVDAARELHLRVQDQSTASHIFLLKELGQYRFQQRMEFTIPQLIPSDEARSIYCTLENNYEPLTWDSGPWEDQELLQQFLMHAPGIRVFSNTLHCALPNKVSKSLNADLSELGLKSLSLVYHDCPSVATMKRLSDFMKKLPPTLETLRIAGFVTLDPVEEQLSTVDPGGSSGNINDDTNGIPNVDANSSNLVNTRIKQLLLEGNLPLHVPLSFIKRCPELRSLSITAFSDEILEIVARYIGEYCPQLEELAVDTIDDEFLVGFDVEKFDLRHLSNLLKACNNVQGCSASDPNSSRDPLLNQRLQFHESTPIKRVGLKKLLLGNVDFSNQTYVIDTLCQHHSSTLTHLAMKSCNGIWVGDSEQGVAPIHTILQSFQKLEYIDFSYSRCSLADWELFDVLDAADLVNSCMTWPFASTLRVLHIVIGGVTRPIAHNSQNDIQVQDQSSVLETQETLDTQATLGAQAIPGSQVTLESQKALEAEASVKIQTKVCQLLGSLTLLEELALGVDEADGPAMSAYPIYGHQSSCLELSLETGLCFMSELKRLRIFKVTRMDHRIGLKELQWMCESWPELKEVRGLLRSQEDAIYDLKFQDVLKEAEIVSEMLDWVRVYFPQLRYT